MQPKSYKSTIVRYVSIALVLGFLGCATPYQRLGSGNWKNNWAQGGYSDHKLNQTRYRVSFLGNRDTSSEQVELFFLRRCSEIAIREGYKGFVIESKKSDRELSTFNGYNGPEVINKPGFSGVIRLTNDIKDGVNAREFLGQMGK